MPGLFLYLVFSLSLSLGAQEFEEADLYVFSDFKKVPGVDVEVFAKELSTYLEESNDFINFNQSVPTLQQSILYRGLSQRQLEINYNGFVLEDVSSPEGTYDLGGLLQFQGLALGVDNGKSSLNIKTKLKEDQKTLSLSGGSLKEGYGKFMYAKCVANTCYKTNAFSSIQGGVSQLERGSEIDFLKSTGLSFSRVKKKRLRSATHFFVSKSRGDDDDIFNFIDDPNALSKNLSFFGGQEFSVDQKGVRFSYFLNQRSQKNEADVISSNTYFYEQEGQSVNLSAFYKDLDLKFQHEFYIQNNMKERDHYILFKLSEYKKFFLENFELGFSQNREFFGQFGLSYNSFNLHFKRLKPSLSQIFDPISGNKDLSSENLASLSFERDILFLKESLSFKFSTSYHRMWDLIEFFDSDGVGMGDLGQYKNVSRGDNFFLKLESAYRFRTSEFSFFLRYVRSKNLESGRDLLRRPRWTSGVKLNSIIRRKYGLEFIAKLVGRRFDFGGEKLKETFFSEVRLRRDFKRGALNLGFSNLLNEERPVYSTIGRRGFQIKLGVDLNF